MVAAHGFTATGTQPQQRQQRQGRRGHLRDCQVVDGLEAGGAGGARRFAWWEALPQQQRRVELTARTGNCEKRCWCCGSCRRWFVDAVPCDPGRGERTIATDVGVL
ncbi:hypothetical protein TcCL_Unassigned02755 [Trypanosoma cruzi]|nr:hypothetical protein TcCL_Unassigned02755 [Trypanosoma cruzi]